MFYYEILIRNTDRLALAELKGGTGIKGADIIYIGSDKSKIVNKSNPFI